MLKLTTDHKVTELTSTLSKKHKFWPIDYEKCQMKKKLKNGIGTPKK